MKGRGSVTTLADQVLKAIHDVAGPSPVALHEPTFSGNEWLYLKECLDSTFVSSVGKFVDRFEGDLASFTGAKHAVVVVNGTAALHIALKLSGVKTNDEVLIPALTFVATANAVTYCGATPHFADSEVRTLGIDAAKLRDYLANHTEQRAGQCVNRATGRIIRALVPMHTFGHPADLDGLLALAYDFNTWSGRGCGRVVFETADQYSKQCRTDPYSHMSEPRLIVIGAGGHAHACIDVIEQCGSYEIVGLIGLPEEMKTEHLGYAVMAVDSDLPDSPKIVIARSWLWVRYISQPCAPVSINAQSSSGCNCRRLCRPPPMSTAMLLSARGRS